MAGAERTEYGVSYYDILDQIQANEQKKNKKKCSALFFCTPPRRPFTACWIITYILRSVSFTVSIQCARDNGETSGRSLFAVPLY